MSEGLQVWDASGTLVSTIDTNMARVLGMAWTGGASGQLTHPGFATGIWFTVTAAAASAIDQNSIRQPNFYFLPDDPTTLHWVYPVAVESDHLFVYGVY